MEKTQILTVTEMKVKTLLLQKEREGRHLERAELNRLCCANWRKTESSETREPSYQNQRECRDGVSPQEHAKRSISTKVRWRNRRIPRRFFSQASSAKTFTQSLHTKWSSPKPRGLTWVELWKNLRVHCAVRALNSNKEAEESAEQSGMWDRIARRGSRQKF